MEFIYLHRKALESSFVSSKLNLWLDLIFGYKQRGDQAFNSKNIYKPEMYDDIWQREPNPSPPRRREIEGMIDQVGQIPPQLFTLPHEARSPPIPATKRLRQVVTVNQPGDVWLFGLWSDALDRLLILREQPDHDFIVASFDFNGESNPLEVRFDTYRPKCVIPPDLKHFVRISDNQFAALCLNSLECILIDSDSCVKVPLGRQKITALSSTESLLSLSSSDARTHIYSVASGKLSERFSVPTYGNSILCGCISQPFGVFVSGTDGKALVVGRLTDGSTVRVIRLNFVPQKVIVTPHWGFIVVYGSAYEQGILKCTLSIFNINGIMINSVPFHGIVSHWVAVTSSRGFDFIVLSSEDGKIFAFEAFFLDLRSPIYRCHCDLACLAFSKKSNVIIAAGTDGQVRLIPFALHSVEKFAA
jgi:WD40 repeat protein